MRQILLEIWEELCCDVPDMLREFFQTLKIGLIGIACFVFICQYEVNVVCLYFRAFGCLFGLARLVAGAIFDPTVYGPWYLKLLRVISFCGFGCGILLASAIMPAIIGAIT